MDAGAEAWRNDNVIDLVANTLDPATVYAVAAVTVNGAFNGLVAGTTDGVSWALDGDLLPDTYPLTIEIAPSRPQRLYLGRRGWQPRETGFLAVSDDGGATWTHARRPLPPWIPSTLALSIPSDPDRCTYQLIVFPFQGRAVHQRGRRSHLDPDRTKSERSQ